MTQLVGIFLLALICGLGMFGVFGPRRQTRGASTNDLEVQVEFPERFRYKTLQTLTVLVRNRASAASAPVEVVFDAEYLRAFSQVQFTPEPDRAYALSLASLGAGRDRAAGECPMGGARNGGSISILPIQQAVLPGAVRDQPMRR